jgi:hypothetical protein
MLLSWLMYDRRFLEAKRYRNQMNKEVDGFLGWRRFSKSEQTPAYGYPEA